MIRQSAYSVNSGLDDNSKRFSSLRYRTSTTEYLVSVIYDGENYDCNLSHMRSICMELNNLLKQAFIVGTEEETRYRKLLKKKKKGRLVG